MFPVCLHAPPGRTSRGATAVNRFTVTWSRSAEYTHAAPASVCVNIYNVCGVCVYVCVCMYMQARIQDSEGGVSYRNLD